MPKYLRPLIAVVIIVVIVTVALISYNPKNLSEQKCDFYRNDKTVQIGLAQIKAEIADNDAERAKGLSGRPCIESYQGMLFVFDKPGQYPFWMKDMKFSIDIVWIDANHKVIGLDMDVSPATYPDFFVSKMPAQYVLELPANQAKKLNISLGTEVNF